MPYEVRVVSAHRTPDLLFEYAAGARAAGSRCMIAGAGGAAHLPGMTAAKTSLPVLGVPVQSKALNGLDSLLSIVQMPAGIPVATLAIGAAGATNAALVRRRDPRQQAPRQSPPRSSASARGRPPACSSNPDPRATPRMTVGVVGRRPARPHARSGGLSARDWTSCSSTAPPTRRPASVAPLLHGAFTDARAARAARAPLRGRHLRLGERLGRRACARSSARRAHLPAARALAAAQDRLSEKRLFERLGIPTTRWRAVGTRAELDARRARDRPARRPQDAPLRLRRQGAGGRCAAPPTSSAPGRSSGSAPLIYEELVPFEREVSIIGARSARGEIAVYPLNGNVHADGILRLTRAPYGPPRWQRAGGALSARVLEALPLRRRARDRVLRRARPPDRQRDGAARAQLRALDHRGRGHQPVREPPARDPRPAARAAPRRAATAPWSISSAACRPARALLASPALHLHDYGKEPRPGRKLGHCTVVASAPRATGVHAALRDWRPRCHP